LHEHHLGSTIHVFAVRSFYEFMIWADKHSYTYVSLDIDAMAYAINLRRAGHPSDYAIVVRDLEWCLTGQSTLVHEVIHTISSIWEDQNIDLCRATEELFALSAQRLYEDIVTKIYHKLLPR
jgi:hypothetical protein